jgi:signal transduction histidine kinase
MNTPSTAQWIRNLPSSTKELFIILFLAIILFVLSNIFDLPDLILVFVTSNKSWQLDDMIVISIFLTFALGIYIYRRSREMQTEIREKTLAQEALLQANTKLGLLNSITRHDILNGLAALLGYLEIGSMKTEDPAILSDISKEKEIAELIQRQIAFTKDYQDIGFHKPAWQDVRDSIAKARMGQKTGLVTIDIRIQSLEIFADLLLEKVFFNLIDNALRYGGPKMTTIRFSAHPLGESMIIVVEDDGEGIAGEDKKNLFRRGFGRHTGYGLFLIREILSITGIRIDETGVPGTGARFGIAVPKGSYRFVDVLESGTKGPGMS